MNNKLLGDRVLIEVDKEETTTKSGLHVPIKGEPGGTQTGKVVAVGPGKRTENGDLLEMEIKEGNNVVFEYGKEIIVEGKPYFLVREEDVVMILV